MVASYFLPVILSKTKRRCNGARGRDGGHEVEEWTAEWDREQLLSLQVRCLAPCPVLYLVLGACAHVWRV